LLSPPNDEHAPKKPAAMQASDGATRMAGLDGPVPQRRAACPTANFRTKLVNIRRPEVAGMAAEYALIVVQSAAGSRQR
jgi:hypothetical protein